MFVLLRDGFFFLDSLSDRPKNRFSIVINVDFRESFGVHSSYLVGFEGFAEKITKIYWLQEASGRFVYPVFPTNGNNQSCNAS